MKNIDIIWPFLLTATPFIILIAITVIKEARQNIAISIISLFSKKRHNRRCRSSTFDVETNKDHPNKINTCIVVPISIILALIISIVIYLIVKEKDIEDNTEDSTEEITEEVTGDIYKCENSCGYECGFFCDENCDIECRCYGRCDYRCGCYHPVYVSKNGIIHTNSKCSGMVYYTEMDRDDAVDKGYVYCKSNNCK